MVGVPGDVVSKHERGEIGVGAKRLSAYARALDTSMEWLSGGDTELQKPGPKGGPRVGGGVPKSVTKLFSSGRLGEPTDDELEHLERYIADGGSEDMLELEERLLFHRAGRDQTDEAIDAWRAVIRRKRKLKRADPSARAPKPDEGPDVAR